MGFRISGKNMDVGDSLRNEIQDRITDAVNKYFDGSFSGHVTLTKEPNGFSCECLINLSTGIDLAASAEEHDPRICFEKAAERLEKRLRRYKRKLKDHHRNAKNAKEDALAALSYILKAPHEDEEVTEDFSPIIIAEMSSVLPSLSVSNAVMQMDLADSALLIFRNAGHGGVNVVYRRADGNIGWVDPSLEV
ncbi:MAG: ribosomal subunit interface protein [Hyphomicrobiales bacterium]|nr:ribosome-associated translation inhibitor RaiA [Hyphomicrobiales bacterium]PCJ86533.1 MAG: ribosomal subunit interface protein [Hyphomicrobiales bacterium]